MVYHRLPAFFLVHGFCSFCKDSDKLRCRDDPWDVVGLSCLGVSPAGDANVSEELKEVARLCMLRDFDSLAFTSDSFVTCKIRVFMSVSYHFIILHAFTYLRNKLQIFTATLHFNGHFYFTF